MSEPNSPLKPQAEPGLESSLDWWNPFPELTETETMSEPASEAQPNEASQKSSSLFQEELVSMPVNPDAAPVVARIIISPSNDRTETGHGEPIGELVDGEISDLPTDTSEPPNLIDLISLIQELNQCNGVLLDRVSQLEEALDRSQQALQGQMGQSEATSPQADDPLTAQAQIANLFSQLEFAHQTNQRQHILIETLTAELESSQERAAQLEREAALLQQRYNEQTQLLVQSEGTSRDLQARLQRQQRYTLQFKAALEKCLEMPMPPTEAGAEMIAPPVDSLLLPKAQQIQPWSQPTAPQDSLLPWMKRFKRAADGTSMNGEQESPEVEALLFEIAPVEETIAIEEPVCSKPSAVQLPVLAPLSSADSAENQPVAQEPSIELAVQPIIEEQAQPVEPVASEKESASISYDLKTGAGIVPPPTLLTQLDAVVQPLADRLAEALLSQVTGSDAAVTEPVLSAQAAAEIPAAAEPDDVIVADPDTLLASAMSEAEDALWQDLARLIEVSPEEAVKASLTGDLAAFESLNFEAVGADLSAASQRSIAQDTPPASQPPSLPKTQPTALPLTSNQAAEIPDPEPLNSTAKAEADPRSSTSPARDAAIPALDANPNSPSPLLHPFRPAKAKRSLSSVELPSFLRQEDSKPLPT